MRGVKKGEVMSRLLGVAIGVAAAVASLQSYRSAPAGQARARPAADASIEISGWDGVLDGLISTFDGADVVTLGEAHGRPADAELRRRLVRHPAFPTKVRVIVLEIGDSQRQAELDHYLAGEDEPPGSRQRWGADGYGGLIDAIREVNVTLSADSRLRVLLSGQADDTGEARRAHVVSLVKEHVVQKGAKALVIFGAGHVWHAEGGLTRALDALLPGRVFTAETMAPPSSGRAEAAGAEFDAALLSLGRTLRSSQRPTLVRLREKSAAARLVANPFYFGQAMLPSDTTLGRLLDAIVYFGADDESQIATLPQADQSRPTPPQSPRLSRLLSRLEYRTGRLSMPEIDERLRHEGIRTRLDEGIDGISLCVITEVLRDLMAEKGYLDARVTRQAKLRGDETRPEEVIVTFTIAEGQRTRPLAAGTKEGRPSPMTRCNQ